MGGKALSVIVPRISKSSYEDVCDMVLSKLKDYPIRHKVLPTYFQKADFGDLDIVFEAEGFDYTEVAKLLDATEVVHNNTVTSVGVSIKEGTFQVDLITVPKSSFDFAVSYFSFSDLGNLLGRVAHKLGFKFGHNGLMYVIRDPAKPTQVIKEITITNSFKDALEFCGYSFEAYAEGRLGGFQTLKDIFEYVIDTPYFNKEIFLLDNRNAKARMRDAKRKTYMDFLKYIEDKEFTAFDYSSKEELRATSLAKALDTFPEFKKAHFDAIEKYNKSEEVAKKFNGTIVAEITGLSGKELGTFIQAFKHSFDNFENFEDFVLTTNALEYNLKNFKVI